MTDVRAVRPAVTHPEHRESADRGVHRIGALGHSPTDERRVADDAQTGRHLLEIVRGDAEEGQVENSGVELAGDVAARVRVDGDLEGVLKSRSDGLEAAAGDAVLYSSARVESGAGRWRHRRRDGHGRLAARDQGEGKQKE